MPAKKKQHIAVVCPRLAGVAGGAGVNAWIMHALLEAGYQVTLATLVMPNVAILDEAFGTRLANRGLCIFTANAWERAMVNQWPTPGGYLNSCLTERVAARLGRVQKVDLFIGGENETRFLQAGIQYVHYPRFHPVRPEQDMHWYHNLPGALAAYYAICDTLTTLQPEAWRKNRTLVNSTYIQEMVFPELSPTVLHPPILLTAPPRPWAERADNLVAVGRINGCKRPMDILETFALLRRDHPQLRLIFAGRIDCPPDFLQKVQARIEEVGNAELRTDLSRDAMSELLATSKYGLHAMHHEHFGMGVAEMQESGMLVFAHNSGGPIEILDGDDALLYETPANAAQKIHALLSDKVLLYAACDRAKKRSSRYTSETFCNALIRETQTMLNGHESP